MKVSQGSAGDGWPALVLTAGLGTRLRPLSAVRAKPAVPVAGIPLAGRILQWLAAAGVRQAVLNLHHRPETLTAVIGDGMAFGVRVRYSWEKTLLGSAGGPARALPLLDADRFFLVNGDTLSTVDLDAMARQHVDRGARVTVAVVPSPDPLHYNGVCLDPAGTVTGFTPRGPGNRGWHFIGVQVVDADVFSRLDPDAPADSIGHWYRELIARQPGAVQAYTCDAAFHDIGTAADYLETSLAFARAEGRPEALYGCESAVAAGSVLRQCVLWDHVTVDGGAVLESCVVGDRVHVPGGARYERRAIVRAADVVPQDDEVVVGDLVIAPLDAHRRKGRTS